MQYPALKGFFIMAENKIDTDNPAAPKKRGRPRKQPPTEIIAEFTEHTKPKKKTAARKKKPPKQQQKKPEAPEVQSVITGEQLRTTLAKRAMIEAMTATVGVISEACIMAGITRPTYYDWMRNDPEFKAAIGQAFEEQKDFAESCLIRGMRMLDASLIKFFLKTKCRDRGYIEISSAPPEAPEKKSDALLLQSIEKMLE